MNFDSRTDRSDIIRLVREQASRVYLQTIAANEREDRLLHKKLDALDLEHRAQYFKMKKWIYDAKKISEKRSKNVDLYHTCDCKTQKHPKERSSKSKIEKLGVSTSSDFGAVTSSVSLLEDNFETHAACKPINNNLKRKTNLQTLPRLNHTRRRSVLLHDRVKYTDSEVARLKTSFAGQKTPPSLRRSRKFLPHLEDAGNLTTHMKPRRAKGNKRKNISKELQDNNQHDLINLPEITVETSGVQNV